MELKTSPKTERVLVAITSFLVFGVIGCVVWVFLGPVTIFPLHEMFMDLWVPILAFGIPAALIGCLYPRRMNKLLKGITFFWW